MKRSLLSSIVLIACVLSFTSVYGASMTINFDVDAIDNPIAAPAVFADTAPLTTLYSTLGVTFAGSSAGMGGAIVNTSTWGRPALSGANILGLNPLNDYAHFPETIVFASPVKYVEIWMSGSFDSDTVVMTAYDALNGVIGTSTVASQEWAKLSIASPGIVLVTLDRTAGGGGTEFDNLTYGDGPRSVPVPATMLLFAPGLAGLAAVRRRFKK